MDTKSGTIFGSINIESEREQVVWKLLNFLVCPATLSGSRVCPARHFNFSVLPLAAPCPSSIKIAKILIFSKSILHIL